MKQRENKLVRKDYTDPDGIPRRVFVPPDETDLQTGIPASLDISAVYPHLPAEFIARMTNALHAQGLIEARDYLAAGADQRFKAAMLTVIREDFLSVQTYVRQELRT